MSHTLPTQKNENRKLIFERDDLISDSVFVIGCMLAVLLPQFLFLAVFRLSSKYFLILIMSWSVGSIMGFTSYNLKRRSSKRRKTVRLLKTQHKEFFRQVRSNVVLLLEKGGANGKLVPGNSQ